MSGEAMHHAAEARRHRKLEQAHIRPRVEHRKKRLRTWGSGAFAWLKELMRRLDETRALGVAAETAFWLFLSLIPLLAVMGLLAARFSLENWDDVAPFMSALPRAGRQLVRSELRELSTWNGGAVSLLSAVIFVWLASSGMHSIFDGLELQVGSTRGWVRKRLLAIAVCFLLPVVVALLAVITPGFNDFFARLVLSGDSGPSFVRRLVSSVLSALILFWYVYSLYFLGIPPKTRRAMPLLPGAFIAVLVQIALSLGYRTYISSVGDGSAYVAGLAVIGVTLMGLYLFSVSLFGGAVLNRMLADATQARLSAEAAARADSPDTPRDESRARSRADEDLDPSGTERTRAHPG